MDQPQTPGSLTVAEKEQIIAIKVKQYEAEQAKIPINKRKLFFSTTGEFMTRTIRDAWASDMPIQAMNMCIEGFISEDEDNPRMAIDLAVKIVTGKMMLIGDSRIDSYPGGIEVVEDDGRFNLEFDNYSIDVMISRIEKYYIEISNYRTSLVRILNMLKDDLLGDEDDPILINDSSESEWLSPKEIREKVNYQNEKIKRFTNELDFLYPIVGKSLKDLPIDQIGTESSGLENELARHVGTKRVQKGVREREIRRDKENAERLEEERDIRRAKEDLEAHRGLITPVTDEELKDVTSCWLLPDGTMFGGPGYAFIHDHIRFYLKEDGYFKKLKIEINDEDKLENMNWCKLSQGHGFMLYDRGNPEIHFSEAQRLKIIDWMIVREVEIIRINNWKVPLRDLMNMDASDMMDYSDWRSSDKNPNKKEPIDPNQHELTDDELLDLVPMPEDERRRRKILTQMQKEGKI